MLRVFVKPLHPELLPVVQQRSLTYRDLAIDLQIGSAGHLVTFRRGNRLLSEGITERTVPFNQCRCYLEQRIRGCRTETVRTSFGWQYSVSCQLESVEPDVFLQLHAEMQMDALNAAVSFAFPSRNRLSPAPLSLIRTDFTKEGLSVQAFHTFPAHCAIVRTQSLLELD